MSPVTDISTAKRRGCSACALPAQRRSDLDFKIESGVSMSLISRQFEIPRTTLYSHANHSTNATLEVPGIAYTGTPTQMLVRLEEVSDDMRTLRRAAVAAGATVAATKAAAAEVQALTAIGTKLGVEDTDLAKTLDQLVTITTAFGRAARRDPALGALVVQVLRDTNNADMADELEASFTKKEK